MSETDNGPEPIKKSNSIIKFIYIVLLLPFRIVAVVFSLIHNIMVAIVQLFIIGLLILVVYRTYAAGYLW